ncbi:hypothetical protein HC028_05120 [Planosporangium flavigriseum]|uniref:ACT domain-containing protein n=1 Tax=Planosporangium flavigriseum TaxID=373681 RepID=A0A8J3LVH9_9ACTN|nr:hypothetical protein [Planosporangium flavigriseum]NJC63890.1 hypothetical protein [Planosporangium flavigriseum]GIG74604.1 hypothetical protein Pfl04_30080 [Planosporangium flavigriseum]
MVLWRVRATVDDRPGYLSVLTASLALRSVNILAVQVHATEAGAVDEFLVDAPQSLSADELVEAIRRGRGRDPWVCHADARGLVDEPTRALGIAAMVAADPSRLESALSTLLGCEVDRGETTRSRGEVTPGGAGGRPGFTPNVMVLAGPAGDTLVARRNEPAFMPAEFARAQALVQVAMAGHERESAIDGVA